MMNPIRFGLAVAATASLGFAHGDGVGKDGDEAPLLDNLFQGGMTVSYKAGEGITIKPANEKDFSLNFGGQVQPIFSGVYGGDVPDANTFNAQSARTRFGGHVFNEDVTYFLQVEHAAAPGVLDGWIGWRFFNDEDYSINLRVGAQKMRSSLQADASLTDTDLEFARNSIATSFFAGARSIGALLEGAAMKAENGQHKLHWHLGAMNNATANYGAGDPGAAAVANAIGFAVPFPPGGGVNEANQNELDFTFGVMFSPNGSGTSESWSEGDLAHSGNSDVVVGANVLIGNDSVGAPPVDNDMYTLNGFVGFKSGSGIAAQGEVFVRSDEPDVTGSSSQDSLGFYAQGSYTMAPGEGTQWGFGGRFSMVDIDNVATFTELAGGVNAYYHKHKLKTQIMLRYLDGDPQVGADASAITADVLFTLMF